jgi:hypothetical protein
MRISIATALLLLTTALPAASAGQSSLDAGDRVRVRALDGTLRVGIVDSASANGFRLTTTSGATYAMAQSEVATLERSLGEHRRFARNLFLTVGIAGASGGLISAAAWQPCRETGFLACFMHPDSRTDAFGWGLAGGALLGIPIGVLVGLLERSERWEPLPVPAPANVAFTLRRSSRGLELVGSLPLGGRGR